MARHGTMGGMSESGRSIHCGACGSERLTPATKITASTSTRLMLTFRQPGAGWLAGTPIAHVSLARVCRDCGHVMTFLKPEDLAKLDAAADGYAGHEA